MPHLIYFSTLCTLTNPRGVVFVAVEQWQKEVAGFWCLSQSNPLSLSQLSPNCLSQLNLSQHRESVHFSVEEQSRGSMWNPFHHFIPSVLMSLSSPGLPLTPFSMPRLWVCGWEGQEDGGGGETAAPAHHGHQQPETEGSAGQNWSAWQGDGWMFLSHHQGPGGSQDCREVQHREITVLIRCLCSGREREGKFCTF